jgi:hypothetical protein
MSLARLALRLAAYEALNPAESAVAGPWPTLAGQRVYDTRIDEIQAPDDWAAFIGRIEGRPIVSLYTEEETVTPYGQAKYPAEESVVCLTVEMMIAAQGTIDVTNADGTTETLGLVTAPVTDRQREGILDVLEAQIRRLLDPLSSMGNTTLFRGVAMERRHIRSVPQRAADRVTRLAARTLHLDLKIKSEAWPRLPVDPPPTGFDLLPEPLRTVAKGLPAGSTGALFCTDVASWLQSPPALVPLDLIALQVGMGRLPTQPDGSDSDVRGSVGSTS